MDLCRLCSLSKLCHLHQCSLSVRPLLEKTNVRKNMQLNRMCHDLYLLSGDVLPRIPIKIECCTRFEYSYCCGLFIESIQYSIKAFSEWNEQAKKNSQTLDSFSFPFSWTEYFIYISLFYRTHAWHNFCYIHCWCIFLLLLLLHSFYDFLSISEINNDKTWMNESKWLSVISLLYNFCVK